MTETPRIEKCTFVNYENDHFCKCGDDCYTYFSSYGDRYYDAREKTINEALWENNIKKIENAIKDLNIREYKTFGFGETIFHLACKSSTAEIILYLINTYSLTLQDLRCKDSLNNSALHSICSRNLLKDPAILSIKFEKSDYLQQNDYGKCPLSELFSHSDLGTVNKVLSSYDFTIEDLRDMTDEEGNTFLHYIDNVKDKKVLPVLKELYGGITIDDVIFRNEGGKTPLHLACEWPIDIDLIKFYLSECEMTRDHFLIETDIDSYYNTPLLICLSQLLFCRKDETKLKFLNELIDLGIVLKSDITARIEKIKEGRTFLHQICYGKSYNYVNVLKLLITKLGLTKEDFTDIKDDKGESVLDFLEPNLSLAISLNLI